MSSSSLLARCCAVNIENPRSPARLGGCWSSIARRQSGSTVQQALPNCRENQRKRPRPEDDRSHAKADFLVVRNVGRANVRLVCSNARARCRYSVCLLGLQRECCGNVKTASGFQCLEVVSHIFGKYVETIKRVMK